MDGSHAYKLSVLFLSIAYCSYWCEGCLDGERRVLLQIKDSINHPNGKALPDWVGEDCCKWKRVVCDESTSHVKELYLSRRRNESQGIWYPNVTLFSEFKQLQIIELQWNQLSGPDVIKAFCGLKFLQTLTLDHNKLKGVIPPCLGHMRSLKSLYLQRNYELSGNIPSFLSNLTMIEDLDFSYNRFGGKLSFSIFSNLTNLTNLDLSNNYNLEVETESPTWSPSFQLQILKLGMCNLNKHSGSIIPSFLSTQNDLLRLDLSRNSLVGSIPSWMFFNISQSLSLKSNMFDGPFPQLVQNLTSWLMVIDLSDNHVYGTLPANIGECFQNLYFFNMSSNYLHGSIPLSFGEISTLEALDLSNNKLSGVIPQSLTAGGNSLLYLSLSNNSLQGQILPRDSNMTNLLYLQLHSNCFTGTVPPSLANSPDLVYLDIRNNYLSGDLFAKLPIFRYMRVLLLRENHFKGLIPRKLCQMQNLQFLDLSSNYFLGSIPSCLNNITFFKNQSIGSNVTTLGNLLSPLKDNGIRVTVDFTTKDIDYSYEGIPLALMTGIDMSSNRLTGNIPYEIGDLIGLRSLNLSNNVLSGPLPISFQNLKNIESLDLSHNKLNGSIPHQMNQLSSLSTFNVSFNNLRGKIPYENHFTTFNEDSFFGNSYLCGKPLERNCSLNTPQQHSKDKREEASRIVDSSLFFYSFVALSYVCGFCGVITLLILNNSWRKIYFKTVDRYIESCLEIFRKYARKKKYQKKMDGSNAYKLSVLFWSIAYCWCWCEGCLDGERRVLLQIKESINHPNGAALPDWVGEDCCKWELVVCDESTSHVKELHLIRQRHESQGTWYPNVTLFSEFKQLQIIELQWNQLSGPDVIKAFCGLKFLQTLTLDHNKLKGVIPPCLGHMRSLKSLYLQRNYELSGNIPSFLSNLTMIEDLDFSYNRFGGKLSFSIFSNLKNLISLDLSNNYNLEVETESPTWSPSFQLQILKLGRCNLNKHSGSIIPSFLSTQNDLLSLDLSRNSLVGSIPSWMFFNISQSLSLKSNMFDGPFPQLVQNLTSWLMVIDLSDNHVYGTLPANIGACFQNLYFFNMSSNYLHGSIPLSFGEILKLEALDLSINKLSGIIPQSLTAGGNSLLYLSLSNNSLQGQILPRDSNMTNLLYLQLHSNCFTGTVPPSLANSPDLVYLDIRNNYLSGDLFAKLPVFPYMRVLLLKGNHFKGLIPRKLCQMQSLQFLDLSSNYFLGSIPSCLNNITFFKNQSIGSNVTTLGNLLSPLRDNGIRVTVDFTTKDIGYSYEGIPLALMTGIDMSSNRLTGNIPYEIGDLIGLRSLNLSNNVLSGPLPISFQNLKNIESLDLSHNKLNGSIPHQMNQLSSLSTFYVSFNNLTGKIPYENHFTTFNEDSFFGNSYLCGKPLERNCSLNTPQQHSKDTGEEASRIVDSSLFFYSFVALSYVCGFCGVITFLILNNSWRKIYFKTVDRYIESCLEILRK
ncbi:uncharacterized protein LOC131249794 [Magnolia sinica]|uniref:uncharacterized protein LOC131249794 n=1 Tax=Magnolia sinica TaxID=86752 RepID=UPI00265B2F71|nr:uncharacterized protein LOC131249794 [Magnolia sinica]